MMTEKRVCSGCNKEVPENKNSMTLKSGDKSITICEDCSRKIKEKLK